MEDEINEEINVVLHYLKNDMKFKCESFEELKDIFLKRINNNTLNVNDYQFFIDGESNPINDENDFNILKNIDAKIKEITVKNYKIKPKKY